MIQEGSSGEKSGSIASHKKVELEITKSYLIATEAELRAKLHQAKIPKSVFKGVPSIHLPNENGKSELNYVFQHPFKNMKELTVKTTLGHSADEEVMAKNTQFWEAQNEKHFQTLVGEAIGSMGISKLPNALPDFEEWSSSRFNLKPATMGEIKQEQGSEDEKAHEEQEEDHSDNDEDNLVGLAAKASSLARSGSASSLGIGKLVGSTMTPKPAKKMQKDMVDSVESKESKMASSLAASQGGDVPAGTGYGYVELRGWLS